MKDEIFAMFTAYISRVLFNARMDYIRKLKVVERYETTSGAAYDSELARLSSVELSPLEQVASADLLQRMLASLSEIEAAVLYRTVCLEDPAILVADGLGISAKSVSRIKSRALAKLRDRLEKGGVEDGI